MAETASESAPSRARFPVSHLSDLALQTCDDADHLNEVLRAYTALEKLVEPAGLQDCETLTPQSRRAQRLAVLAQPGPEVAHRHDPRRGHHAA